MRVVQAQPARPDAVWRQSANWHLGFGLLLLLTANFSVAISQIALGLTVVALLWRRWRGQPVLLRTGLEWTVGLLAAWALAMVPLSTAPHQSLVFYKRFYLFTAIWTLAPLAADETRRRLLAGALLTGAAGISLVGLVDITRRTGGFMRDRLDQVTNPMTSGALLMLAMLAAAGLLLARGLSRRERLWVLAAAVPIMLALLNTMTRSAVLGLLVGVVVMLLALRPRLALWFAVVIVAASLLLVSVGERVLPPRLWSRIDPSFVVSGVNTTARTSLWRGGWKMISERPLTGVGDRDLLALVPLYVDDPAALKYGHMHNNIVHLAVIWGLPGCALAVGFLLAPPLLIRRRRRRLAAAGGAAPWQEGWLLAALGAWAGYFVAGLTEWYFGDAEPTLMYHAVLAVALGGAAMVHASTDRPPRSADE